MNPAYEADAGGRSVPQGGGSAGDLFSGLGIILSVPLIVLQNL